MQGHSLAVTQSPRSRDGLDSPAAAGGPPAGCTSGPRAPLQGAGRPGGATPAARSSSYNLKRKTHSKKVADIVVSNAEPPTIIQLGDMNFEAPDSMLLTVYIELPMIWK